MEPTARSKKTRENFNSARSANSFNSAKKVSEQKNQKNQKSQTGNIRQARQISQSNQSNQSNKSNHIKQNTQNKQNLLNNQTTQNHKYIKNIRNNTQNVNYINNIDSINNIDMAGVGVLNIPGRTKTRSADLDRYRERARESKKFPNRRRKIITGKDLTTPLRRAKVKEKKIYPKIITITIAKQKKKFPFGVISCLFACTVALSCLIWSHMVLNSYSHDINRENKAIAAEVKRERDLESELELKNDLTHFVHIAENELGMVKEDLLPKHYIAVQSKDRTEIVEEPENIFFKLPGILSALLGEK